MSAKPQAAFSGRAIAWLAGVCGGSLVLAFLLTAFPSDLGEPPSAGADSYSWSALGHRALAELLRQSGHPVRRMRSRHLAGVDSSVTVLLAEPTGSARAEVDAVTAERIEHLREHAGAIVLVLPKWIGIPEFQHPEWIVAARLKPLSALVSPAVARLVPRLEFVTRDSVRGPCHASWGLIYPVSLHSARLLRPSPHLRPLVTCDSLLLVAEVLEERPGVSGGPTKERCRVVVISDPDVLNNQGLGAAGHAALVAGVFDRALGAHAVAIDEHVHGFGLETGLAAEVMRFPLVLALIQALLLAGFVVWAGMGRFGKPFTPAVDVGGKRALIDTTSGLLQMTGQAWETLRIYYLHTLRAVGERYCLPADLDESGLQARLAEIAGARGIEQDVVEWGRTIQRHCATGGRPELMLRLAAGLHRWREEMIHDH